MSEQDCRAVEEIRPRVPRRFAPRVELDRRVKRRDVRRDHEAVPPYARPPVVAGRGSRPVTTTPRRWVLAQGHGVVT